MNPITILLAEDHTIVRQGLRKLLESEADLQVIGEAQTGRQTVEMVANLRPDVVVMDIAMPILNGLEATRQIRKASPATKVIILSAHADDAYVEQAMEHGAAGYLLKQSSVNVLCAAVRAIQTGKTFLSPSIAKRFRNPQAPRRDGQLKRKLVRLTTREMEVLQLIAEGRANKETAAELGIGIKTVEKHREHLMQKLDIHETAGLTRYAIAGGIIESSVQITNV